MLENWSPTGLLLRPFILAKTSQSVEEEEEDDGKEDEELDHGDGNDNLISTW